MADLIEDIKAVNNFWTVENMELKYTLRSTNDFKKFGYLDEIRRREQLTMIGTIVVECYRMCKPSECAAAQELFIQVEERKIAEMIL